MFKIIIIVGLVVFAVVAGAASYATNPKSISEAKQNGESMDWSEYGRIDKGELAFSMRANDAVTEGVESIPVTLEFKNISSRTLHVLKTYAGDNGKLYNSILEVGHNGEEISYKGMMVKIAPDKKWYVDIKPGESFISSFNLLEYYPMHLKAGDKVTLKYDRLNNILDAASTSVVFDVR